MGTRLRTSRHQDIRVNRVENGCIVTFGVFVNKNEAADLLCGTSWEPRQRVFEESEDAAHFVAHYLDADPVELATETEGVPERA